MRAFLVITIFAAISPSQGFWEAFDGFKDLNLEKLGPISNLVKPLTEFPKKLEKIVSEDNPELGKSLYKKLQNFMADLNTIMSDKNDGLTMLEKKDKFRTDVLPRWQIPLALDFIQLSKRTQWKIGRAALDMAKGMLDGLSEYYDTLIDEEETNFEGSKSDPAENFTTDKIIKILQLLEAQKAKNERANSVEL